MKFKILLLLIVFFALSFNATAETLYLKNGRIIKGKKIEQGENYLILEVVGHPQKFYFSQLKRIESDPGKNLEPLTVIQENDQLTNGIEENKKEETSNPIKAENNLIETKKISQDVKEEKPVKKSQELLNLDISEGKELLIIKLMTVSGVKETLKKRLEASYKSIPMYSEEELKEMLPIDEILYRYVPIYHRYYSEEEIQALIDFHESPVGRKTIEVTPSIIEDIQKTTTIFMKEKFKP